MSFRYKYYANRQSTFCWLLHISVWLHASNLLFSHFIYLSDWLCWVNTFNIIFLRKGVDIMSITKPIFLNLQFLSVTVNYPAKSNVTCMRLGLQLIAYSLLKQLTSYLNSLEFLQRFLSCAGLASPPHPGKTRVIYNYTLLHFTASCVARSNSPQRPLEFSRGLHG